MSRDEALNTAANLHGPSACDRADLQRWSATGGPLPARLAEHVRVCRGCDAFVRRVGAVHSGLMLLRTQPAPLGLPTQANTRALRMLRRAVRASEAAERLLRMRPGLSRRQRLQVHLARLSIGAAAASISLLMRAGVVSGFERTREVGESLAALHWERHIDPEGQLGPRDFA